MFCPYCGKEIDNIADVCLGCGRSVKKIKNSAQQDSSSVGWWWLGFFFPLIGFILWCVWTGLGRTCGSDNVGRSSHHHLHCNFGTHHIRRFCNSICFLLRKQMEGKGQFCLFIKIINNKEKRIKMVFRLAKRYK